MSAGMRIVKLGGRVQQDAALPAVLAAAWRRSYGALCVVHGGGDEMSALQRSLGLEPRFVGGRRVTEAGDIALLRMALSGLSNKQLVAALVGAGVNAVGLSGEDAGLLEARHVTDAPLGLVGTPATVNVSLLWHLLDGGYLPVVSPVSRPQGHAGADALNVNGDDAAAAIAVAVGAEELLLVADVAGVLVGGAPRAQLTADEARALITSGEAAGGMAAKLEAALDALAHGVARVRIGDVAAIADDARGTTIRPTASTLAAATKQGTTATAPRAVGGQGSTDRAGTGVAGTSPSARSFA